MDKFKQQIQQKLVANIIVDKCRNSEHLIFRDAWCSQERVLRFATPFFRKLFSYGENATGLWKTGDFVMYEIENQGNLLTVNCVLDKSSCLKENAEIIKSLFRILEISSGANAGKVILKSWNLVAEGEDVNKMLSDFGRLIEKDIPYWEQEIKEKLCFDTEEQADLHEGALEINILNKYERNPKARAMCIAANGTACKVCGIDFAKAYGPEFAGKIEVHHIVPISEIGEDYVVDPVKDLVPVCPNCHTALHSKKDGVYTVEELIEIRKNIGL